MATVERVGRVAPMGRMDLLAVDPSASPMAPVGLYLEIDTETGEVSVGQSHQSDNAVPMRVWHGIDRRIHLSSLVDAEALTEGINAGEIDALVRRVCAGTETVWDGNNHVARCTPDVEDAEEALREWLEDLPELTGGIWDAADWLQHDTAAHCGVTADSTDEDLERIAGEIEAEAAGEDALVVGVLEHLEGWRQDARPSDDGLTQAGRVSDLLHDDGTNWRTDDGRHMEELTKDARREKRDVGDVVFERVVFDDGSALLLTYEWWDVEGSRPWVCASDEEAGELGPGWEPSC